MSYWDASALVKLYLQEPDSPEFQRFAADAPTWPLTARLGVLEVEAVAWFKAATGQCPPAERDSVLAGLAEEEERGDLLVAEWRAATAREYAEVLRICYSRTPPIMVRAADAMHLAAARLAGETELVFTDVRQRAAALACGLTLFPPPLEDS